MEALNNAVVGLGQRASTLKVALNARVELEDRARERLRTKRALNACISRRVECVVLRIELLIALLDGLGQLTLQRVAGFFEPDDLGLEQVVVVTQSFEFRLKLSFGRHDVVLVDVHPRKTRCDQRCVMDIEEQHD